MTCPSAQVGGKESRPGSKPMPHFVLEASCLKRCLMALSNIDLEAQPHGNNLDLFDQAESTLNNTTRIKLSECRQWYVS